MNLRFTLHPSQRRAMLVVVVLIGLSRVGMGFAMDALNIHLKKEPVPLRRGLADVPRSLGSWEAVGDDQRLSAEFIEELGTDQFLTRSYEHADGRFLQLHLAYYTGMIDAVPHVPDRCLVATGGFDLEQLPENLPLGIQQSGWKKIDDLWFGVGVEDPLTGRVAEVFVPAGDLALRTSSFVRSDQPGTVLWGGYFFVANGKFAATPESVKRLAFDPSQKMAYYCKVQLVTQLKRRQDRSDFVDASREFLELLLPHLMRSLPDWRSLSADLESS